MRRLTPGTRGYPDPLRPLQRGLGFSRFRAFSRWYDDVRTPETERLAMLLSPGARVTRLLDAKDRLVSIARGPRPPGAAIPWKER